MSGGKRGVGPFFQMSSNLNDDDGDGNTGDGEDGSENIFFEHFLPPKQLDETHFRLSLS